jgi:hypothetical protein
MSNLTSAIDILILTNGPGELSTWVRPVLRALRAKFGQDRQQVRISVVISPCVNANGQEFAVAQSYPEVDRVQAAEAFMPFLLWGKTQESWDWRPQGVVIYLGGDQFPPVVISKRLGYRTVSYIEWDARWVTWLDRLGVRQPQILERLQAKLPENLAAKCRVVGDLMADTQTLDPASPPSLDGLPADKHRLIALMPGSKPGKLRLCVPLMLAVAERLQAVLPDVTFVIPVAPMLGLTEFAGYADPQQNTALPLVGGVSAQLRESAGQPYLETAGGLRIDLWTSTPAYPLLRQCQFCLTTIGANTAELAALAIPMVVLLPMQELWQDWDGLPGLLTRLPGVGRAVGNLTFWSLILKQLGWPTWRQIWATSEPDWGLVKRGLGPRSWPNLWAGTEIVPELVGALQPEAVTQVVLELLKHPEKLAQMRANLEQVRGSTGAAANLVELVAEVLPH